MSKVVQRPCPHCGADITVPAGVIPGSPPAGTERLFDLESVATRLQISIPILRAFLSKGVGRDWPRRYIWRGRSQRRRMLTSDEVKRLSAALLRGRRNSGTWQETS